MSEQGLSIFDDEPERDAAKTGSESASDETRVMPRVPAAPPKPPAAAKPAAPASPAASQPRPGGATAAPLPIVRRGYDQAAVDARLRQHAQELSGATTSLQAAQQRIAELEQQLRASNEQLAESHSPTYAGLGGRASAMLRLAEEEAGEIRANAERDAAEIRAQATRDAKTITLQATQEMDDLRTEQLKELEEHRARLVTDAESERSLARAQAEDLIAAAKREAGQLRLAAEQETTEMRTSAQREVEQARAGADREVQEARRMLAVEKERLAREATDFHNSKLAETRRLVEEAESRAVAAEERARTANNSVAEVRQQAQADSESLLSRARREAEQIISSARTQADQIANASTAEAERANAVMKAELDRMSKRRDAITAQLASLNDLVSRFTREEDAEPEPRAAQGKKSTESAADTGETGDTE